MKILPAPYELMTEVQNELSRFLECSIDSIMDEWHTLAAEELDYKDNTTYKQIEDGLREILETLTAILGGETEFAKLTELAIAHGKQRCDLQWHIKNLVTDYELFRRVIIHRYREFRSGQSAANAERAYHEEMVLHWLIDKSISSGAQAMLDFTLGKDRVIQAELKHRMMNTLTMAGVIAKQVAHQAQSAEDAGKAVEERMQAMGNAQKLLLEEDWKELDLKYLVNRSISSFKNKGNVVNVEGPEVNISAEGCRAIYLILHELATNAVKYGALSNNEGKINIRWRKENGTVSLDWTESDGPEVKNPEHKSGYGTTLMKILTAELNGKIDIQYPPEGVRASLEIQQ